MHCYSHYYVSINRLEGGVRKILKLVRHMNDARIVVMDMNVVFIFH